MGMAMLVPKYTAAEIRQFDDSRLRFEVIRGELFVTPAPGTRHQRAVVELTRIFAAYLEEYSLGEVIVAPYEVEFAADTAVQPDLLVVLRDRARQLTAERFLGAPSLVIEVISYSSKRTDRLQKRQLYQEEGVPEYWVVDAGQLWVERWPVGAAEPETLRDELRWQPDPSVPALVIDLRALFEKVGRGLQ